MYSLEVIKSESYQAGKQIKDNFNRESSFCASRSGVVIHSGVFRSTAFIPANTELHNAFRYWIKQGQTAQDAFIDAIVGDCSDAHADLCACKASRPEWKFSARTRKGFEFIQAERKDGKLAIRQSANSWREIHYLTK